ncbi:MAG TPA: tetratricopeptide repeat protein [Kofleriaceae bacterium]|nr:tetratricopeptide repeat protein [Kofleriaceae bacterium]
MENPVADLSTRAQSLIEARDFSEALDAIDEAIELAGLTPALDLARADALIGLEQFRGAYEVVRNLLERGGDQVRARSLVLKARILRRSSRWLDDALEAALDGAQAAIRQGDLAQRTAGEAHLEAARCYARKQCRVLATRELDRARELMDGDPLLGYYEGALMLDFDDRPAARDAYTALLQIGGAGAYYGTLGLGYLEYVMGEFAAAHRHLDQLEPLASGDLWPRRVRLQIFDAEQRWRDAATAYTALREASPEADSVWRDAYERAHCLYRAGALREAVAACEEILSGAPEDSHIIKVAARMARCLAHPEVEHRPRRRLKEFPSVTQLKDHCGPASCELYLRYFGLTDDQMAIAREIKRPDGGTPVYKMRRYLEGAGFEARRVEADLPTLKRLLDAGIPVIMEESYSSSSHVAVAIGYDDALQILEVQDPMTHRVRETFYEDLAGLRNLSNHGALIAAPKTEAALVRALDQASGGECRYISLVDEAWAALDDDRPADGDALVNQSVELHRAYEYAWMYRFRRARTIANDDPTPDNRVSIHRILAEITALWPDDEWPQQLLGQALYFDDRTREALVAFERARDRDDNDAYNWSMIADCQLDLGNQDAAYDALVEALARDPSYVRPNENLADLALRRGRMTLAWALNEAARELHEDNAFNHGVHGQLLEGDGRFEEALAAFDRGLELDPERDWLVSMKAKLLARMDRDDAAIDVLKGLVARRSELDRYKIDLADLYYEKQRPGEASEVCREILARDPSNASAHAILGASLAARGEFDDALATLQRALELRPTYVWVYKEMGKHLLATGRTMEAIQAFAAALGMSGGNAYREFDLGDALVSAGYDDEGVRHLRSAGIHGRLDEAQLMRIGELIVAAEDGNAANSFFDAVTEQRPDDLAVLRAHAHTLLDVCWAPGAAQPVIDKLQALAPEDPYALVARGEELLYQSLETEHNGEELLTQALALDPSLSYGRRVLGDSLVDRGRFADAIEMLTPCAPSYSTDKLRVKAHLGLGDFEGAEGVIATFRDTFAREGAPCVGALMLEYLVARRRWDWKRALELAEEVSRATHERDDDGRLDTWEVERFECMAHLGQHERALRFGEAQATDAESLARLAYSAYHTDQMRLAGELAERALRLDPDTSQALAVIARNQELAGDVDAALATWERVGDVDEEWHAWHEQIARIALAIGDAESAIYRAQAAVDLGHLCPWSFAVRAQALLLAGDREAASLDLERSWMLAPPETREHEAHDVWALRAALAGRMDEAEKLFEAYLTGPVPISQADKDRVARVREAL